MKVLKPLFTFTLLLAFLGSTLGIQVYKHYCGDFLEEVSLYIPSNPCADEGGEDACSKGKKTSCCDDETEYYQLEVDLIKNSNNQKDFKLFPIKEYSIINKLIEVEGEKEIVTLLSKPPPLSPIPIYKNLQRLVYYG